MIVPQQLQKVKRRKFKPLTIKKSNVNKKRKINPSWIPFMISCYIFLIILGFRFNSGKGLIINSVGPDNLMSAEAPSFNPSNSIGELPQNSFPFRYIVHNVREDETISLIAFRYSLKIETILNVNKIRNAEKLLGKQLIIPEVDGFIYRVSRNDSLDSIAEKFDITKQEILNVNSIPSINIAANTKILISNSSNYPDYSDILEALWLYPVDGVILRQYGETADPYSKIISFHNGIDIRATMGQEVKASRAGEVFETGFHNSFGRYLFIKHEGGSLSFYGHLESINVSEFEWVDQQTVIGTVGNSGYCSGYQLHFSIIMDDDSVDPMELLL